MDMARLAGLKDRVQSWHENRDDLVERETRHVLGIGTNPPSRTEWDWSTDEGVAIVIELAEVFRIP
jgi:hypothetical protein